MKNVQHSRRRIENDVCYSPKNINVVGMITKDRVEGVRRGLPSYIENTKIFNRKVDFIVVDDSKKESTRNEYLQVLQDIQKKFNANIFYVGKKEKIEFSKSLSKRGLPPDVVNFSLLDAEGYGRTAGANRNALLLASLGSMIIAVDDDTICNVASHPKLQKKYKNLNLVTERESLGLNLCTDREMPLDLETWNYPDRDTAFRAVTFHPDQDFLGLHEQLLGKKIEYITPPNFEQAVDINGLGKNKKYNNGKILVTFNGLVGDCGRGTNSFLFLKENSLRRLTQTEKHYTMALNSREVAQMVTAKTVTNNPTYSMGGFLGLDNRKLLPPFMPVLLAQDHLFGHTVWKCFKNGYFGHLPFMGVHSPLEMRQVTKEKLKPKVFTNLILLIMILQFKSDLEDSDEIQNLRLVGNYLKSIGSLKLSAFKELIKMSICEGISSDIGSLEKRISNNSYVPNFWKKDIKKLINLLRKTLPNFKGPYDLINQGYTTNDTYKITQCLIFKFGELLDWWPEIVEAARDMQWTKDSVTLTSFK